MGFAAFMPILASLAPSILGGILAGTSRDPRYAGMQKAAQIWNPQNYQSMFGQNLGMFQNSPMFKQLMMQQAAQANRGNQQIQKSLGPRAGANVGVSYNVNSAPAMGMAWQQAQQATERQLGGQSQALMGMGGLPTHKGDAYGGAALASLGNSLPYILQNWNKWFPQKLPTTPQNPMGPYTPGPTPSPQNPWDWYQWPIPGVR